jgi:hypothetical protein
VAITWEQIEARVRRLNKLSMGLAREEWHWWGNRCDQPLLFVETRAYLKAIRDALAGVETARVVLAKAAHRCDRGAGQGRGASGSGRR